MNRIKLFSIAFLLFIGASNLMNAQSKVAHVDSQELIETMDAYKQAQNELEKIEKSYRDQIDDMMKEAQKTSERYQAEADTKTEEENQRRMMKLQEMQQSISEFSQDAQQDLQKKRESLLRPVLEKAREVIQEVAREKGYDYVLDSSVGSGVLMADGTDLINDVKAALNNK